MARRVFSLLAERLLRGGLAGGVFIGKIMSALILLHPAAAGATKNMSMLMDF
jgi:hypothetical protein